MDTKIQNRGQDDRTDKQRDQRQQNQNQNSGSSRMDENLNPQGDREAHQGSSNYDKEREVTAQKERSAQNPDREAGSTGVDEEREKMEAQYNRSGQNAGGRENQQRQDNQQPRSRRLNEEEDDRSEQASYREGQGNREQKDDKKAKVNQ